jgi:putative ABC transport system permease protein
LGYHLFHTNLYDLACTAILFPGLTPAFALALAKRTGRTANLLLTSALAVIVLKTGRITQSNNSKISFHV